MTHWVLRETDAVVEVLGWDEAFLAVETENPEASARDVQRRVRAATDLDCSVGIGQNNLQAKLATGFGKPAGVFRLTHESWFKLLGDRPTDVLWGIGSKTAKRLSGMGISTVLELAQADPQAVVKVRFAPSSTLTHGGALAAPSSDAEAIEQAALACAGHLHLTTAGAVARCSSRVRGLIVPVRSAANPT